MDNLSYRLGNNPSISILCESKIFPSIPVNISCFFSQIIPFNCKLQDDLSFQQTLEIIVQELQKFSNHSNYLRDIFYRYPALTEIKHAIATAVINSDNPEVINQYLAQTPASCVLVISSQKASFSWYVDQVSLSQEPYLKSTLEQIPGHLQTLLTAIIEHTNIPIKELPLLTSQERKKILIDWNKTRMSFESKTLVHQLFEQQCLITPNRVALIYEGICITYDQLNTQANKLAHLLIKQGAKPNKMIILCLERSLELVIGLFGILKSGSAYIPIEINYPIHRIKDIVENADPVAVVTHTFISRKLSNEDFLKKCTIINIDQLNKKNCPNDSSNPVISDISADNISYVIYTSGSTGKPKGVLISHRGIINCILAIINCVKIKKRNIFLAIASISFDVAGLDYYLPLSIGGKVVMASSKQKQDTRELINLIQLYNINVIQATPSMWENFRALDWCSPHRIKMLLAGEALPSILAKYLLKNGNLYNIYGPTEATVYATFSEIKKSTQITIGKPLCNVQVYVLDINLQPLPIGFNGELYIGGLGVAQGYLNNPELTQHKFIKNSFSTDKNQEILYKTGDLVRWLPDGNIEYLGRIDEQVKIRGFRVELDDIEQALLHHPKIMRAAVIVFQKKGRNAQLIGFIVPKVSNENKLNGQSIKTFLKKYLPSYMIPDIYKIIREFPLSSSGKVDKKVLCRQVYNFLSTSIYKNHAPSRNSLQNQLITFWKKFYRYLP